MRPCVVSHMIMSLDGRLLPQRWGTTQTGSPMGFIERIYEATASRLEGDAWAVGRGTMKGFFPERDVPSAISATSEPGSAIREPERLAFLGARENRSLAVIMDPSGRYVYDSSALDEDHLLVVLSNQVNEGYLAHLRDVGISYTFAGQDGRDIGAALESLTRDFGVSRLLLEGGGTLNGAFLAASAIDDISTLVYPVVDGLAGIPSIYDHAADAPLFPAAMASLELLSHEVLDQGVVWLRYAVLHAGGERSAASSV